MSGNQILGRIEDIASVSIPANDPEIITTLPSEISDHTIERLVISNANVFVGIRNSAISEAQIFQLDLNDVAEGFTKIDEFMGQVFIEDITTDNNNIYVLLKEIAQNAGEIIAIESTDPFMATPLIDYGVDAIFAPSEIEYYDNTLFLPAQDQIYTVDLLNPPYSFEEFNTTPGDPYSQSLAIDPTRQHLFVSSDSGTASTLTILDISTNPYVEIYEQIECVGSVPALAYHSGFLYESKIKRLAVTELSVTEVNYPRLTCYPIPATTRLYIENSTLNKSLTIYTLSGKIIFKGPYNEQEGIDLTSFSTGRYFLSVEGYSPISFIKQ